PRNPRRLCPLPLARRSGGRCLAEGTEGDDPLHPARRAGRRGALRRHRQAEPPPRRIRQGILIRPTSPPFASLPMPTHIPTPTVIQAAGNKPKRIEEFVGRVNTRSTACSIARMVSPGGWEEPGQRPEFDEYTLVLRGRLKVEFEDGELDVLAGQAVIA